MGEIWASGSPACGDLAIRCPGRRHGLALRGRSGQARRDSTPTLQAGQREARAGGSRWRIQGRWLLPFEEWVVSHARVAKKPHRGAKLEDTLTFFHQLSTLVSSGTPLLQALEDRRPPSARASSSGPSSSRSRPGWPRAARSTRRPRPYPHIFEFQWIEAIRTGEVTGKMAPVLVELNKQIRDSRETRRKVKASLMYP